MRGFFGRECQPLFDKGQLQVQGQGQGRKKVTIVRLILRST